MRKRVLVLLTLAGSLLTAQTDVIRGVISDIETRQPIEGANILIMDTHVGTISDNRGEFSILYTGVFPVKLQITYIGYDRLEISAERGKKIQARMTPVVLEGEEIIVSGTPRLSERDVQAKTETVSLRQVEERGIRDVSEALQEMEAVNVTTSETGKQYVSIRGSNFNEVSVYLDGVKLNRAVDGIANLGVVDMSNLDEIEVIKGGTSILFGPGNFGGLVLLHSRKPETSKISLTRSIGITDENDQDLSIGLDLQAGLFGLGGRYSGKARLYDGESVFTTIFNNLQGAINLENSNLMYRYLNIDNTTKYISGGIITADKMTVNQVDFTGKIFNTKGWDFQAGTREWEWEDDFYSNINRRLKDKTEQIRAGKTFSLGNFTTTIQVEKEYQEYIGDQEIIDTYAAYKRIYDFAELTQDDFGYAGVIRYQVLNVSPTLEKLLFEFGMRRSDLKYAHTQQITNVIPLDTTTYNYIFDDELQLSTFRLGSYLQGRSNGRSYTVFFNQGYNQRAPTLNDRQTWGTTYEQTKEYLQTLEGPGGKDYEKDFLEAEIREVRSILEAMAEGLDNEYITTTEINLNLFSDNSKFTLVNSWEVGGGVFRSYYLDKVMYKHIQNDLLAPYNRAMAWLNGYEVNSKLFLWKNRLLVNGNFTQIFPSDENAFPNKPGVQMNISVDFNYRWFNVNLAHLYLGSQNYLRGGFSYQELNPQHTTNLTLAAHTNIWWLDLSCSYAIRNLFSNEVPELLPGQETFEYYQVHRQLLTLKLELQRP